MKKTERKQMMEVLAKLQERFTGSGVDHKWRQEETRYGVWLYNSYHAIDNGSYAGWADFALFFRWDEPLIEFKLHFIGKSAAYLNKKHDLRSYLTDTANWILEDCCKGQDVQKLYNGQLAS